MAGNKTVVPKLLRWEAIIEITHLNKAIEDIFLGGILAAHRAEASSTALRRGFEFVKQGNYAPATGCRLRDLVEEGHAPNFVSSVPAEVRVNGKLDLRHPHQARPTNVRTTTNHTHKPFKCPIVNLCKNPLVGNINGTVVDLYPKIEE